jgi:serine phosphatase RsbU (regulator of sigma subunit)
VERTVEKSETGGEPAPRDAPARSLHDILDPLIDALPIFVGTCTPDGIITQVNSATIEASGVDREALIGRPLWEAEWWQPASRRRIHDSVVLAQEGRSSRFDVEVRAGDERLATLDFQLVPILEGGAVTALLPSALDISARVADEHRLRALAALSRELNAAVTTEQATRLVVHHAPAVVTATVASVALVDHDQRVLRIDHGLPPEIAERWTVLPLSGGGRTVWHDAVEFGQTLVVDRDTRAQRYPIAVADARLAGIDTTAAVPLTDASGAVFGAIGIGWSEPLVDLHQVRLRLQLLGDLCSDALRRAQRTDAEHRFVRQLQDEVLAAPDGPADLEVAVAYEPAQADIGFGGDWYDVVDIGAGCTAFVVGDVVGHGLAAAARMSEAKATIRSMVLAAERRDVIPAAGRSLAHLDSGYIATAAVAWIDASTDELQWATAGHVPPVLRTPAGEAMLLDGPLHPPIGMPTSPRPLPTGGFPPGSLLVLCTDGLIERRGEAIDAGMERLRSLVAAQQSDATAADVRDALLRELHADESDDDVAIVVVRNP